MMGAGRRWRKGEHSPTLKPQNKNKKPSRRLGGAPTKHMCAFTQPRIHGLQHKHSYIRLCKGYQPVIVIGEYLNEFPYRTNPYTYVHIHCLDPRSDKRSTASIHLPSLYQCDKEMMADSLLISVCSLMLVPEVANGGYKWNPRGYDKHFVGSILRSPNNHLWSSTFDHWLFTVTISNHWTPVMTKQANCSEAFWYNSGRSRGSKRNIVVFDITSDDNKSATINHSLPLIHHD